MLFNIALDPLITALEARGLGVSISGARYSCLAFADDTVLVAHESENMQEQLHIVEQFCQTSELAVNVDKCAGFHIWPHRKTFLVNT